MDGRLVVNPAGIHICLAKKFGVSHNYQIWERALESLKNGAFLEKQEKWERCKILIADIKTAVM